MLKFWKDESALVTLEWVALAAAVIILAVGVVTLLVPRVNSAASTVGTKLVNQVNSNS